MKIHITSANCFGLGAVEAGVGVELLIHEATEAVESLYGRGLFAEAETLDVLLEEFEIGLEDEADELQTESMDDGEHVMGIEDLEGVPFKDWEPYHAVACSDAYGESYGDF